MRVCVCVCVCVCVKMVKNTSNLSNELIVTIILIFLCLLLQYQTLISYDFSDLLFFYLYIK